MQHGVLQPYCNLLVSKDWRVVSVILDGLVNILSAAEKIGEVDKVAYMIEEIGGLDKIEALQSHENEQIYAKAVVIIDRFYSEGVSHFFF